MQLFEHLPGVTVAWWMAAGREERDAVWEAAEQVAEWARERRRRMGLGY